MFRSSSRIGAFSKIDSNSLKNLSKITPSISTARVISSFLKIISFVENRIISQDDWKENLKFINKKEGLIIKTADDIYENIDLLINFRKDIIKIKTLWFGKWKISPISSASSFQKEWRPFVNFIMYVYTKVKEQKVLIRNTEENIVKQEENIELKPEEISIWDITKFTPDRK